MTRQNYRTPPWLFEALASRFGPFVLDAAADEHNAMCGLFYSDDPRGGGLGMPWLCPTFCNPPFSSAGAWVSKALSEWTDRGVRSVLVLPVGCSQKWFHALLACQHATILYPSRRISFNAPDGTPTTGANRDTIVVLIGYSSPDKVATLDVL